MYKKNALYFPGEFNIDKDVTLLCLHFTKVKIGSQSSNTPNLTNSIKYNSIYNVTSTIVEFFSAVVSRDCDVQEYKEILVAYNINYDNLQTELWIITSTSCL
jgi:hypothetical protein